MTKLEKEVCICVCQVYCYWCRCIVHYLCFISFFKTLVIL